MQVILHTVHISNAETLASKFVTLRAKKYVDPNVGKRARGGAVG